MRQERRAAASGSASPNRVHDPPRRGEPEQLLDDDDRPRRAAAARRADSAPNAGHQNTSLCAHDAAEHEPGEPADRQAQRAAPAQPVPAPGRDDHHDDEHDDRDEQRVRVRLRAERRVEQQRQQRAERDEPEVEARALEDVPDAEDRRRTRARGPSRDRASSAAFTSASASVFCSRRTCCEVDVVVRARAALAPPRTAAAGAACFTFHVALELLDHEHRVGAHAHARRARNGAAASSPAISARYSATLLVVDADALAHASRAASADRSTGRARPRRSPPDPGLPARTAVAVDRRPRRATVPARVEQRVLGHGTRIAPQLSQYATSAPAGAADALGFGRRDRQVARLARRADEPGRARALVLRPAALVVGEQRLGDRPAACAARAAVFVGELGVDLGLRRAAIASRSRSSSAVDRRDRRVERRELARRAPRAAPSPRALGPRARSAGGAASRRRPASPGARAAR